MTSNVLPLHFAPSQASSSQNSNFDNTLEGYKIKSALPYKILSTLVIRWRMTAQTFSTPYGLRRPHWRGRWGWLRFWSGGWWGRWCPLHHTPLTTTNCKKDIQHNFSDTLHTYKIKKNSKVPKIFNENHNDNWRKQKLHWVKSGALTLKNLLDNTKNQERTRKDISWTALAWTHKSKRCHSILLTKVFQTMERNPNVRIMFISKSQLKKCSL